MLEQADLADAADRGQRRAHLVRDVGCEAPHLVERLLESAECLVEDGGQAAHLVFGVVHGQASAEALGGDRPRALGHALDGAQRAARQRERADAGDGHRERKAERQHQPEVAQLLLHRRFGLRDLDDDRDRRQRRLVGLGGHTQAGDHHPLDGPADAAAP